MREDLRRALTRAIRAHDSVAVSALRSALAAIENAQAVDLTSAPPSPSAHPTIAGSVAGAGATEVERQALTEAQVKDVVSAEISERLSAALSYERLGHRDRADRLRREAEVLATHVSRP